MSLKKNTVSYLAWLILLFFTGVASAFFGLILSQHIKTDMIIIAAGLVTVFFAVSFVLYLLTGVFVEKSHKKADYLETLNITKTLERILVITLFCLGFVLRVMLISHAGEEAAYFEVTKVTDQKGILVRSVQGAVYFYCILLHGLFRVVGNRWIAGIWVQIVLQLIGISFIYMAIKRLMSRIPALLVLGFMLFAPVSIRAGLTYSAQILYFCFFALGFWVLADYLRRSTDIRQNTVFLWFYTVFAGIITGIICYLDISGFLLLFMIAMLPMVKRENEDSIWIVRMLVMVTVLAITVFVSLLIDSILSGTTVLSILNSWKILYSRRSFSFDSLVSRLSGDFIVLIVIACIGCFSFWRKVRTEKFTPHILMTLSLGALIFSGITTENMDGSYLLYVLMAILATVSITEMFGKDDRIYIVAEEENEDMEFNVPKEKIEFIENPLPVPKKHVKKTMDYAFIPDDNQMKYDVQVAENDDFDLK